MSDIIILNNDEIIGQNNVYEILHKKLEKYISIIEKKTKFIPQELEELMTVAYAVSGKSSCLKRKVGALIVDSRGNIVSSGYNEVPISQKTCKEEYGTCHRDYLKNDFNAKLQKVINDDIIQKKVFDTFKKDFKILDYCKSLHAEENAILNLARLGSSNALQNAKLYTTTYPCTMCANKIAQVGIKEVIYYEPYPLKDAKKILIANGIIQHPFEGVTYNGYFKFWEATK